MMLSAPATLLTGLVTLLAILIAIGTAMLVARVRTKTGVQPPAMSGHPSVERALTVVSAAVAGRDSANNRQTDRKADRHVR